MTKYVINTYNDGEWTTQANFSEAVDLKAIEACAVSMYLTLDFADVAVIDADTGEVMWNGIDAEDYDEPGDIDDDCGFDPYCGCYTDDC